MVVDTISYLNADYLFQAIELDKDDQQQFLNKFTTGDGYSELTLVYKTRFNTLLLGNFSKNFQTKNQQKNSNQ